MKKITMLGAGLAAAVFAAAADAGASAAAATPAPGATDPNPALAPDAAASAEAVKKTVKEAAKAAEPETAEYRITADFHDTTTGKLRKKGRKVRATEARRDQLVAAKVINPEPLDDDAEDEGDDDDGDGTDSNLNNPNALAPVGVDGPVDDAVLHVLGDAAGITDGSTALSTAAVPAIVTGNKAKAK
jgi:hypothetical protein